MHTCLRRIVASFCVFLALGPAAVLAKRAAPPAVAALTYEGVTYSVVRETPGLVRFQDAASGEILGEKQLYAQAFDPGLERDVQQVFIVALVVDESLGCVVAQDELGRRHPIDKTQVRGFCGSSRFSPCLSDSDCVRTGCSGEVCAKAGEDLLTVCLWQDCFNAAYYRKACRCVSGACQWTDAQ